MKTNNNIISKTAVAHGWGSDPYKWVSGLTPAEKDAVRNGETVIVTGCPPSGGGNRTGTTERRVVLDNRGQFTHRLP